MNCLLAHPTGNNFVREAAMALHSAGMLGELHLGLASCGNNLVSTLSYLPGMSQLKRRTYPPELSKYLHLHPWRESVRLLASRFGFKPFLVHESGYACVDASYRSLDMAVANRLKNLPFDCVYAYEDGALNSFRQARELGLRCVYDLPIAYWKTNRRIMEEEAQRLPEWRPTLKAMLDSPEKCARKDEELESADCIICPSKFVADSLPASIRSQKQVHVIPFGSPTLPPPSIVSKNPSGKIRVLFAGSMTQRKGLADLMQAMRLLNPDHFELHIMGSPNAPMEFYHKQYPGFRHHGPRPHHKVLELMQECDVFVLPSLVEGRALVQQEALACGLPIIVTANAGAEDLVEDDKAGFLVPIRSPEAIAEKLELLRNNPEMLQGMKEAAPTRAASVTWSNYRKGIIKAVSSS